MLRVSKDKFKKILALIAMMLVLAMSFAVLVNADDAEEYVIEVIDPKENIDKNEITDDGDISLRKEIVRVNSTQPYYDSQELKYRVTAKNVNTIGVPQIALLVDTSYSVSANEAETQLKTAAKNLATGIFNNCDNAKIQLFNAAGQVTSQVNKSNASTITNGINNLAMGVGNDISTGINVAKAFPAVNNAENYLIIFTDTTDNTREILENAVSNDIKVIVVAAENIMSNSYVENGEALFGRVQMIYSSDYEGEKQYEEFNIDEITDYINLSLVDVSVQDVFTEPFIRYFDFELLSTEDIENTSNGFIWTIDRIKRQEEKTIEFKMKLKQNVYVEDRTILYNNIYSSDSITATYKTVRFENETHDQQEPFSLNGQNTPIIKICNKYSITIKAVSEEDYAYGIEGIQFRILAVTANDTVVYDKTTTTNSDGEITISDLTTTGRMKLTIQPTVNKLGYSQTDQGIIELINNNGMEFYVDSEDWKDKTVIDNKKRNIKINFPINTNRFNIEVNLAEKNKESVKLSNVNFRLLSPKASNPLEFVSTQKTTNSDGKILFTPSIMSKPGSYDYILSQISEIDGYYSMGDVSLKVTFGENGVLQNIVARYNDKVSAELVDSTKCLVNVVNESEEEDLFNFQINLSDVENSAIKIQGASYDVDVERVSNNEKIKTTYPHNTTDEFGNINLQLPGNGNIVVTARQTRSSVGYEVDTNAKKIIIERKDGVVSIIQAYSENTLEGISTTSLDNGVLVNLYNKKQNSRNILRFKLIDAEEIDIPIQNVRFELINETTNELYYFTTDADGYADVQINSENSGVYTYSIRSISGIPRLYKDINNVRISVEFDDNKTMTSVSDLWNENENDNPIQEIEDIVLESNENYSDTVSVITLSSSSTISNTYKLKIHLSDANNSDTPIENAIYDIKIRTSSGIERDILQRYTDSHGDIETSLLLDENIFLEITQKESKGRYKKDPSTKNIVLHYNSVTEKITLDNQSDPTVSIVGGKTIVYNHQNSLKTGDDIMLNFTVSKVYDDDSSAANTLLHIYQLDGDAKVYTRDSKIKDGTRFDLNEVNIPADELLDSDEKLDVLMRTNNKGTVSLKNLRVKDIPDEGEAEANIIVEEMDDRDLSNIVSKTSSQVLYHLIYRYNVNTEEYELTNVEITKGIRYIKEGSRSFGGNGTSEGYLSYLSTTLYSSVDITGNLVIDILNQDLNGNILQGVKYDIEVIQPNSIGNRVYSNVLIDSTAIELRGIIANPNTEIILRQTEPAIGYAKVESEIVLKVTDIDETGEIYLSLDSYDTAKQDVELPEDQKQFDPISSESGTTSYRLVIKDKEQETFKIKMNVIDKDTGEKVQDYSFNVVSKNLVDVFNTAVTNPTDNNGETTVVIGPNYKSNKGKVRYVITAAGVAQYYRAIDPINLIVSFEDTRKVEGIIISSSFQEDTQYGELANGGSWYIKSINQANSDVEIDIYVEKQAPLEVEIETVDIISGNKIDDVEYKIGSFTSTPDTNTRNALLEINYPDPGKEIEYTIENISITDYDSIPDQVLNILYNNNGDIDNNNHNTAPLTDNLEIVSVFGRKIKLRIKANPRLKVNFITKDSITDALLKTNDPNTEITYTVTAPNSYTATCPTEDYLLSGFIAPGLSEVEYIIRQSNMLSNYEPEGNKTIKVSYGADGKITDVTTDDSNIVIDSYQNNEINVIVKNNPRQGIYIENTDYHTNAIIPNGVFSIIPRDNVYTSEKTLNLGTTGKGAVLGSKIGNANTSVRYLIKQTGSDIEYSPADEFEIEVFYGDNREITDITVIGIDSKWVTASILPSTDSTVSGYNGNDKGIVKLVIKNNYTFRINITNKDRFDNREIANTKYEVTSDINTSGSTITGFDGTGTASVGRVAESQTVIYSIREIAPAADYQALETDTSIDVQVSFDENGFVIPDSVQILRGAEFAELTEVNIQSIKDNFVINVTIKNIPKLRVHIKNVNRLEPSIKIVGAKYEINSEYGNSLDSNLRDSDDNAFTRVAGRTAGREITYTLRELSPEAEYQNLQPDVLLIVRYTDLGKIDSVRIDPTTSNYATCSLEETIDDSFDMMRVNIKVTSMPKVRFNFTNVDRTDSTTPISGTEYEITSNIQNGNNVNPIITGSNGKALNARVDGVTQGTGSVEYTIHEKTPSFNYQNFESDIKVRAYFDADGKLTNVEKIEGNEFAVVKMFDTPITSFEQQTVELNISNNPTFTLNIVNNERITDNPLKDTEYEIIKDDEAPVEIDKTDGLGRTVYKGKTTDLGREVVYTIHEKTPSSAHQALEEDIKLKVTFDESGRIVDNSWRIIQGNYFAIIEKNPEPETSLEAFTLNLKIINNPYVKFTLNSVYSFNNNTQFNPIEGTVLRVIATDFDTGDVIESFPDQASNYNGVIGLNIKKALTNKKIKYTITEVNNVPGYEVNATAMVIVAEYDAEGLIIESSVGSADDNVKTVSIKPNEFSMEFNIISEPAKEFAISITAHDMYDDTKPLQGVKVSTFLEEDVNRPDSNYAINDIVTDADGTGKGTAGKPYTDISSEDALTRILRLKILNVPTGYQNFSNTIGAQNLSIAIRVKFSATDGKVERAQLILPGQKSNVYGWMADNSMIQVKENGYGIIVNLHFYPLLSVKLHSQDLHTKGELGAKLYLSTSTHSSGTSQSNYVTQGWVGDRTHYSTYGTIYNMYQTGNNYNTFARTETEGNRERILYLFEMTEPGGYQKLRRRDPITYTSGKIIATLKVKYNERGKIENVEIMGLNINGCGLQEGFVETNFDTENNRLELIVKYVKTTTMSINVKDSVSKKDISGVKVYPFNDGNSRYYQYGQQAYEYTNSLGNANWKYWGINTASGQRRFLLKLNYYGTGFNGYYGIGDIEVLVNYDTNGNIRSAEATSLYSTTVGKPDVECTWNGTNVHINVGAKRKFVMELLSKDKYDNSITPNAKFSIQSQSDVNVNATGIIPGKKFELGEVLPGKTVTYIIKDISSDGNYKPLPEMKIKVIFNNDGSVKDVQYIDGSNYYIEKVYSEPIEPKLKNEDTIDLILQINKIPLFRGRIYLFDKFYPSIKLAGGEFTIDNSMGDTNSTNIVTDNNGYFNFEIGEVYPNRTVIYTLKQANRIYGYQDHTEELLKFEVDFNASGYINNYRLSQGTNSNLINITDSSCKGTRNIPLNIYNIPIEIKYGIINKDVNTNERINDTQFEIFVEDLDENEELTGVNNTISATTTTNGTEKGTAYGKLDDVEVSDNFRVVRYTLKQINVPSSYRKIEDTVLKIIYYKDGGILSYEVESNPSNVKIEVAKKGNDIKTINGIPVQVLFTVDNDNTYDLIVKNEDIDFLNLPISGSQYTVSINGVSKGTLTTNDLGEAKVAKEAGSGEIEIRISEVHTGSGYRDDLDNNVIFRIYKGEQEYELREVQDSNSNPLKAEIDVDEAKGIVKVTFKNRTKFEIGIHKYDSSSQNGIGNVEFEIYRQEVDAENNPIEGAENEKVNDTSFITNDNGDIRLDLGSTEANKRYMYTIKEITPDSTDQLVGTMYETYKLPKKVEAHIPVSFDMYGRLEDVIVLDNKDVTASKISENPNGFIASVSNTKYKDFTLQILRKNATTNKGVQNARYLVKLQEISETGTILGQQYVLNDTTYDTDVNGLRNLNLGKTPVDKHYFITIEEIGVPNGQDMLKNPEINFKVHFNKWGEISFDELDNPRASGANIGDYGVKITISNKNFANFEVGVHRRDIVTNNPVKNAEYIIKKQELNYATEDPIGDEVLISENLLTTDSHGKIRFDTGEKPESKCYLITFEETNRPAQNQPLKSNIAKVKVYFDQYGELQRYTPVTAIDSEFNIYSDNGNGIEFKAPKTPKDLEPYKIKVITEDSVSGKRINDSVVNVKVDGIVSEDEIYRLLEEDLTTADLLAGNLLMEKGVAITTEELNHWGDIDIIIDQKATADGYTYSDKTSGIVKIRAMYTDTGNENRTVSFELIQADGFLVSLDSSNKIITIKIKNDPVAKINLKMNSRYQTTDAAGNLTVVTNPLPNTKFNITSQIQTGTSQVNTELDETSTMTDVNGEVTLKLGKTYPSKTVIYTIKPILPDGYEPVDDIQLLVKYNTSGNIKYKEILSDRNYATVHGENGIKDMELTVYADKTIEDTPYKVVLELHSKDDYTQVIPGATYDITVQEEFGQTRSWTATTDEDGLITSVDLKGYGRIKVTYTEQEAADGFARIEETHFLEFTRDRITKQLNVINNDDAYNVDNPDKYAYVFPQNEISKDKFDFTINKIDFIQNTRIIDNPAIFELVLLEKHIVIDEVEIDDQEENDDNEPEEATIEREETIATTLGIESTGSAGKAAFRKVTMPQEEGTYRYKIIERQAPSGYAAEDGFLIDVTYIRNSEGNLIITNIENASEDAVHDKLAIINTNSSKLITINIKNSKEADVIKDNEYSLDITKVDGNTNEPIAAPSLFKVKLPDSYNTEVYAETSKDEEKVGKLDYCYIEQNKDYEARLTHMPIPKLPTDNGKDHQTLTYVFKEILAPDGYSVIKDEVELSIEFAYDEGSQKTYIVNVTSSNPDYLRINNWHDGDPAMDPHIPLSIDILNGVDANKKFEIIYDPNDDDNDVKATNMPENGEKLPGNNYIIDNTIPEREGYTFKGWSIIKGQDATYQPGNVFAADQDITLYAVWYENLYIRSTEYFITGTLNLQNLTKSNPGQDVLWLPGQVSEYEEGKLYIKGIRSQLGQRYSTPEKAGTFLDEFLANIQTNAESVKVYTPQIVKDGDGNPVLDNDGNATLILDKDGNRVIDREQGPLEMIPDSIELNKKNYKKIKPYYIKTGMIAEFVKGDEIVQLTLIARGDLLESDTCIGNGSVDNLDAAKVTGLSKTKVTKMDPIDHEALDIYVCQVRRFNEAQREIIEAFQNQVMAPMGVFESEE